MYKSILIRTIIISLSIVLLSCAAKKPSNRNNAAFRPAVISISKANTIIKDYLQKKDLAWGEATMIRNAPNRYIYNFETPKSELEEKGPRRLVIDIITGQVKLPSHSGGVFGKQPIQNK